jgi:hypothetical protein
MYIKKKTPPNIKATPPIATAIIAARWDDELELN